MTARSRGCSDAAAMVAALERHVTSLFWLQYGEKPKDKLKQPLVQKMATMLKDVRPLAENFSFVKSATQKCFRTILERRADEWTLKDCEHALWVEVQTNRFRTLCRHVAQCITKSDHEDGPPWLQAVLQGGDNDEYGEDEGKVENEGEEEEEEEEEEAPSEKDDEEIEDISDFMEEQVEPAIAMKRPAAAMMKKPADALSTATAAAPAAAASAAPAAPLAASSSGSAGLAADAACDGGAASDLPWSYHFSKETYQGHRHPVKSPKQKEFGELFKRDDAQGFDLMHMRFKDGDEWEVPTMMVSEWDAIQAALLKKRGGKSTSEKIFEGSDKDDNKYFAVRRSDRKPIWILCRAEGGQVVQCRTYEEEGDEKALTVKEMFVQLCKDFVEGRVAAENLTAERKVRAALIVVDARKAARKKPAADAGKPASEEQTKRKAAPKRTSKAETATKEKEKNIKDDCDATEAEEAKRAKRATPAPKEPSNNIL